jgi:hypothetical protein
MAKRKKPCGMCGRRARTVARLQQEILDNEKKFAKKLAWERESHLRTQRFLMLEKRKPRTIIIE